MNGIMTNLFQCTSGVRQSDNLSSTVFSIFINDLAQEIKYINIGVKLGQHELHNAIL